MQSLIPHATDFNENLYWPKEWELLEENGAVLIPMTAYRKDTIMCDVAHDGFALVSHIWTSTPDGDNNAKSVRIDKNGWTFESMPRYCGMSVRLVKDVEVDPQGIEDIIATKKDNRTRKVLIDGVLYILRDERIYNATGAEVK